MRSPLRAVPARALSMPLLGMLFLTLLSSCVCGKPPSCCRMATSAAPEAALPPGPYARDARQSAWSYLAAKYDADGDERITAEEHGRGEAAFQHLDSDKNGAITADDLGPGPVHGLMARMIFMHWLQDDEDPRVLTRAEFERGLAVVDADGSGAFTSRELARHMEAHEASVPGMPVPPPGMDPFLSLELLADEDRDHAVSTQEALAYFDAHAQDGAWSLRRRRRPPPGKGRPEPAAAVGETAPDFTLHSPDGKRAVTLSSFRGKQPVALLFGSYT
ncbi:MAG: hypothetical protein P1V36_09720 [Planctomycetota bacterium]|nr:hypothetical protein [Planctomycetota bacterium]